MTLGLQKISRSGWVRKDVEDELSEMPHLVLNQARARLLSRPHARIRIKLESRTTRGAWLPVEPATGGSAVRRDRPPSRWSASIPLLRRIGGVDRYVVGCDGARSAVRLGQSNELHGELLRATPGA